MCPFLYSNRNGKQSVLNAKFKIYQGCSAVDIMWYIIWSNRALFEVIINLTFVKCRLITPPQVHFRDFYCSNAIAVPVIVWCNNRKYRSGASGGKAEHHHHHHRHHCHHNHHHYHITSSSLSHHIIIVIIVMIINCQLSDNNASTVIGLWLQLFWKKQQSQ